MQKPYKKGNKKAYEDDIIDRSKTGEYYHIDSIQFNDSLKYTTLKNHRVVYGGGGIIPDIFVPVDTSEYSTYYRDMLAKGVIYQYALDYVDKHRAELKSRYATAADFDKKFELTAADMQAFIAAGEKAKVSYNEKGFTTSKGVFGTVLKGIIGRDLYSDQGVYSMIVNHRNPDLQAALKVLNDESRFQSLLHDGNPEYAKLAAERKAREEAAKAAAQKK